MPVGDMDTLPLWLKREKIDAHGLAEELPRRFLARDTDPDRRLRDFRELSRQADSSDGYGGFVSGESPVEMSDPFGDARMLSFAAKLDGCPWRTHKFVMRQALKDRLPADITSRPKTSGISQLSDFFLTSQSHWWMDSCGTPASRNGSTWLRCLPAARGVMTKTCLPSRQDSFLALWIKRFQSVSHCLRENLKTLGSSLRLGERGASAPSTSGCEDFGLLA